VVTGQDPNQSHVHNLNNVRREASRHFRNKKKKYQKAKIDELDTNSKIRSIETCIGKSVFFEKSYQPSTDVVKDEKGDLVNDSHIILAR